MQARPRLSVITPLLNRAAMLPTALESVAAQGELALEHLVVDGGSTDGSIDIVRASPATLIDAPGTSIYEAINLGLARAQGDVICLLNSDDRLPSGAGMIAIEALAANTNADLVRGRADIESKAGDTWTIARGATYDPSQSRLRTILFGPTNINACFFRRDVFRRIGQFNPSYRISADREWLMRALLKGVRIHDIDQALYIYRSHPGSLTLGANKPARLAWVREHLAFTADALNRADLTQEKRRDLRAFHGKETAHLAFLQFAAGNVGDALKAMAGAARVDALWAPYALGPLTEIVARRLSPQRSSDT